VPFDDAEKIGVEKRMAGRRQALPGGARNGVGGGAGADGRCGHGGAGRWQPESEPAAGGLVPAGAGFPMPFAILTRLHPGWKMPDLHKTSRIMKAAEYSKTGSLII